MLVCTFIIAPTDPHVTVHHAKRLLDRSLIDIWCAGRDLNPHGLFSHDILSVACLPIPSPAHNFSFVATTMCWLKTVTIWTEYTQIL